ncbi:MAG: bi-domain-containing oxidoreductase [Betaproteobacteria bacterium]|nr:bi-domain-containing oxidoreductase [Betaproteobacteria bacterium]
MPRPTPARGEVLVRVRYSLISTGTEIASLRPGLAPGEAPPTLGDRAKLAATYLGLAARHPRKAVRRVAEIAYREVRKVLPEPAPAESRSELFSGPIAWRRVDATHFAAGGSGFELTTDSSEFGYQAMSGEIAIPAGTVPIVEVRGTVSGPGPASVGLLGEGGAEWIGSRNQSPGAFEDRLIFAPGASTRFSIVVANAGVKSPLTVRIDHVAIRFAPAVEDNLPQSELDQQGWNVGYSAAGEVVAVGAGVSDLSAGDLVACGGAGKANHADYVAVPRNLVCRVPAGCDLKVAATTTVGAIALQGVRRAEPQLGETVCVLGLGLIGQITAQLLAANGVTVLGFDLDAGRLARARELGLCDGETDPERFQRLVRDRSGGQGADRVLITAATKSDAPMNLAMALSRRKGCVVIVGDVGLHPKRDDFYRKEIDLRMSTSYGPGRYDRAYEEEGRDYPFAYVRWTLNRNMRAYLELAAAGRIHPESLVERVVAVNDAPRAYAELAKSDAPAPLAVLIEYPDETRALPEPPDAARIVIRGHRPAPAGPLKYALVGAGAFGTSMLVPQMARRPDRFFLRGVVSRNATTSGNFARANQVEVLASDLEAVLSDPGFDLVVSATRHNEHADQVVRCLQAGKAVFVEKPLAITWEELDRVARAHADLERAPMVMVGFNRRFSPAMRAIREATANRKTPLVVHYRLNGGYIPPDHWIQGPQGGGRNIGEACHMYDCFRFLAGAPVASIEAAAIDPGALPYLRSDNFSATLRYADGSLCTLTYTALGPREGLPKERVEVFCDGEAYVLDDYRRVTRARTGEVLWEGEVDKGHFEELSRFGDALATGGPAPIAFEEIVETTAVALEIEDQLHGRA